MIPPYSVFKVKNLETNVEPEELGGINVECYAELDLARDNKDFEYWDKENIVV